MAHIPVSAVGAALDVLRRRAHRAVVFAVQPKRDDRRGLQGEPHTPVSADVAVAARGSLLGGPSWGRGRHAVYRGPKLECADRACLQPMHTPEPCARGLGQCRTDGHRPHVGQVAVRRSVAVMGGLHVCQAALRYVGVAHVGPLLHNCTDAEPGHAVLGWHPAGSLW